ncbi:MmcQ/YjbR family DNA-binding protein [Aminobacter sp. UC22_36]|uniref:MmcQ/YjbR family DNA-binding protein n=1 Tax=Aminobacter sp. UC22_36 TaxID=3374549 RepID=UPI0037580EAB
MTREDVRRIALQLPGAVEKSHFGKPDFRVRDRVFATLPEDGDAVIKLTRDQQELMCGAEAALFRPVDGGWGKQGWTRVMLDATDEQTLRSALVTAWRNTAPITLRKAFDLAGS